MRTIFARYLFSAWLVGIPATAAAAVQTPLATGHFDGAETWPEFAPGDLLLDNQRLSHLRIGYDGEFELPSGRFTLATYIDILDVMYRGRPADWIQWTFTREWPGHDDVPSLDLLVVDRETYELRFRVLPSNPGGGWGGPYNAIWATPEYIRRLVLTDSTMDADTIRVATPVFDFATLGFVFPFMSLARGAAFRLTTYAQSLSDGVQSLAVKVNGRTTITDTAGRSHRVWAVDVLPPSRAFLITFHVSPTPPYFYGWNYRRVQDGVSLFRMRYRGYVETILERP